MFTWHWTELRVKQWLTQRLLTKAVFYEGWYNHKTKGSAPHARTGLSRLSHHLRTQESVGENIGGSWRVCLKIPPQQVSLYAYELRAHWETCMLLFEATSDTFKAMALLWRFPFRFPPPDDISLFRWGIKLCNCTYITGCSHVIAGFDTLRLTLHLIDSP